MFVIGNSKVIELFHGCGVVVRMGFGRRGQHGGGDAEQSHDQHQPDRRPHSGIHRRAGHTHNAVEGSSEKVAPTALQAVGRTSSLNLYRTNTAGIPSRRKLGAQRS